MVVDAARGRGGGAVVRGGVLLRAGAPEELDEALFEVLAERDDAVEGFGPDDHYAFVSLQKQGRSSELVASGNGGGKDIR